MFDESRAAEEGCVNILFTPSSDFFLDSPELHEKSCTGNTLLRRSTLLDSDSGMLACRETSGVHPSEDEGSEVCGGLASDGEEDLDALMSYIDGDDDHLAPTAVAVVDDSPCDPTTERKRSSNEVVEDQEEVESKLCKRQKFQEAVAFHELTSPDVSINDTGSGITQPEGDDHKSEDKFCLQYSTDELQMLCDDFGFEMSELQCSSSSPDVGGDSISVGSARQSRRQKIRDTVKMLREAIPGGECMDAALVLDEAISYVKLLQLQVQALGSQRHAQRAGR